jgi:hypothetical protein
VVFATALITERPSIFIAVAWICFQNHQPCRRYVLKLHQPNMLVVPNNNPYAVNKLSPAYEAAVFNMND